MASAVGDFKGFIDFFDLNAFCDSDYKIFDLKTYDPVSGEYKEYIKDDYLKNYKIKDKQDYQSFISGSVKAILERQCLIKGTLLR